MQVRMREEVGHRTRVPVPIYAGGWVLSGQIISEPCIFFMRNRDQSPNFGIKFEILLSFACTINK